MNEDENDPIHRMVEHAAGRELDEEYRPLPPKMIDRTLDRMFWLTLWLLAAVLLGAFVMLITGHVKQSREFPRDMEFETDRGPE